MIMRKLMRELPVAFLLFVLPLLVGVQGCSQSNQSGQAGKAIESSRTNEDAPLPPEVAKHIEEGVRYLQENKISEALGKFQQAAQLAPNAPAGHLWLGKVYLSEKKLAEAESELTKVLALSPKNYAAMILLGRLCSLDPNRINQAEDYLQQALKLTPDNVEAHFDLGRIYALRGERQKAIEAFNFIFFKERDFHIYHYEVGRILEGWGEKGEALRQYRQALLFNANFAEANDAVQRLTDAQPKPAPDVQTKPAAPGAAENSKQNRKGKSKPDKP